MQNPSKFSQNTTDSLLEIGTSIRNLCRAIFYYKNVNSIYSPLLFVGVMLQN